VTNFDIIILPNMELKVKEIIQICHDKCHDLDILFISVK